MKRMVCLSAFLAIFGFACADEKKAADIRGGVEKFSAADDGGNKSNFLASMLVVGDPKLKTDYDKARVSIFKDTKIEKADGKEAKLEDIKIGVQISVWFNGPVAESYPVQAKAGRIVIHSADK